MSTGLPQVISVTSGKGGVGKTNISVNLAYCLARRGKRVVLLDADLGLANVDVVLGLTPEFNLFHLVHEGAKLSDVLAQTPYGFKILPAASGVREMLALSTGQKVSLLEAMDELEDNVDFLIVDTGAGINDNVMYFNLASQERQVVLTPEPTSLKDAYALIYAIQQHPAVYNFRVLVNQSQDEKMAKDIFRRLYMACDHFLSGVSLDYVGMVPRDVNVRKAVINQKPFCVMDPASPASRALGKVAETIQSWEVPHALDGNIKFFWKRLLFAS